MKVWTNNKFQGIWPVGASAVVVAEDAQQAEQLLRAAVLAYPESVLAADFVELDTAKPMAIVLTSGDY